jgi:putative nucleotidyltransferase with HDIG domain
MQQADVNRMILDIVADRTPRGWLVIDQRYRIIFANDAWLRLWHKKRDQVLGCSLPELLWEGKKYDLSGNYLSPIVESLDSGRELREREVSVYNQNDRVHYWYLANTYLFFDAAGRVEYAAGNYVVIDKFKAIESKLNAINMKIIKSFARAIGARDAYTMRHVENVSALMVGLSDFMRFAAEETALAYLVGLVHDIGKIGIPEAVLNKPGRLTGEECDIIKKHPVIGAEILQEIDGFATIADIVKHHHERWDGDGYPDRLARDAIPVMSRMLAICDAYDAMISARCYRTPFTVRQTLDEISRCAGSQFDPMISRCFIDFVRHQKTAPLTLEPISNGTCG